MVSFLSFLSQNLYLKRNSFVFFGFFMKFTQLRLHKMDLVQY